MNSRTAGKIIFALAGVTVFVLHGLEDSVLGGFKVDTASLVILLIAATPFLAQYLETFKFGNVEAHFRELSFPEQVTTFLKVLASGRKLTFYTPRSAMGENQLGTAGYYLLEKMFIEDRHRTYRTIERWLDGDEEYLRWFASEIIGYFDLQELAGGLEKYYATANVDHEWPDWQLNCLWAHSKVLNGFEEMGEMLLRTKNGFNQEWLLDAYLQMVTAHEPKADVERFRSRIESFMARDDLRAQTRKKAAEVLEQLHSG